MVDSEEHVVGNIPQDWEFRSCPSLEAVLTMQLYRNVTEERVLAQAQFRRPADANTHSDNTAQPYRYHLMRIALLTQLRATR